MTDTMDGPLEPLDLGEPIDLFDPTESVEALLEQWLEQSLTEIGDVPANQEQADRLLWVLRKVRQRRAEVVDASRARIDLVTRWEADEKAKLDRRAAHIEQVLAGWAHGDHEDSGRRTWKLPAGELRVRPLRERCVVVGSPKDQAVVEAVSNVVPEAVKVTREVQPSKVKAVAVADTLDATNWAAAQGVEVPEGYEARQALIQDSSPVGVSRVPGVLFLVPKSGREGLSFTAVTD